MSKTESIPVAKRESDRDDIAAYTGERVSLVMDQMAHTLTLQDAEAEIREQTGPHCDLNLERHRVCVSRGRVKAVQSRVPGGEPVPLQLVPRLCGRPWS